MFRKVSPLLIFLAVLASLAVAQHQSSTTHRPGGAKGTARASSALPSEETVNEFMKHMFGHDPSLTWKIQSIKPAHDPSLAEVTVLASGTQGQQLITFYVTPNQEFAIAGEMVPFGADPFADAPVGVTESVDKSALAVAVVRREAAWFRRQGKR